MMDFLKSNTAIAVLILIVITNLVYDPLKRCSGTYVQSSVVKFKDDRARHSRIAVGDSIKADSNFKTNNNDKGDEMVIQKIVHQSWKSHTLYPNQKLWRENCMRLNPDWEFRIYNDSENRKLIEDHYPWFLETYDGYPTIINQVDAIRPFYLAKYGGVYMDLDYTCLKPFSDLLRNYRFVVAEDEKNQNQTSRHIKMSGLRGVGNSWMAGEAGHPIWVNATRRLKEVRHKVRDETGELAGVWFIRQLIKPYEPRYNELGVKILPREAVTPMVWVEGGRSYEAAKICTKFEDLDKCRTQYPNSTTVSFWTGTWQKTGPHGKQVSKMEASVKHQALLGLRGFDELGKKATLQELEKRANYTGKSGAIPIF